MENSSDSTDAQTQKSKHSNSKVKLYWKSDLNKDVIIQNFLERGWEECNENEYNFYWASVNTIRSLFNPKNFTKINDNVILNHFPNFYELTRKDLMAKNIKKYKIGDIIELSSSNDDTKFYKTYCSDIFLGEYSNNMLVKLVK